MKNAKDNMRDPEDIRNRSLYYRDPIIEAVIFGLAIGGFSCGLLGFFIGRFW